MTRDRLIALYKERMSGIQVSNGADLGELLEKSEKMFFFYLLDSYLNNRDISDILEDAPKCIYSAIELFCIKAEDMGFIDVTEYFTRFVPEKEVYTQIGKILSELGLVDNH